MPGNVKHPAKFSDPVLQEIEVMLEACGRPRRALDPFAGTGRVHRFPGMLTVGVELEAEWATLHPRTIVGNALRLPFADATFDGMVTSPTYGNRLADHHNARDGSRRRSYTHDIGRPLHPDNSGTLHWGDRYRDFHDRAWSECLRVMQPEALLVVNLSNHIRKREEQLVTEWHTNWFLDHGCFIEDFNRVPTRRLRDGANRDARVEYENVVALRYVAPVLTPEEDYL